MTDIVDELRSVLDLERELQSLQTRGDPERLRELLAPTFIEIGASGRRWDRTATLELLARETTKSRTPDIGMTNLEGRYLAADMIQVFWDSDREGRRARRTSLWQRQAGRWHQIYHQGTVLS